MIYLKLDIMLSADTSFIYSHPMLGQVFPFRCSTDGTVHNSLHERSRAIVVIGVILEQTVFLWIISLCIISFCKSSTERYLLHIATSFMHLKLQQSGISFCTVSLELQEVIFKIQYFLAFCGIFQSSREMLLRFSRDYLSGEGDVTRHLNFFGYVVTVTQTQADEYDYAVTNLAMDLRDGVRLTYVHIETSIL